MKTIDTLVDDIFSLFGSGHKPSPENILWFGQAVAKMIEKAFEEDKPQGLRMSNLGTPCERKLWYMVNQPEAAEPLPPQARLKFAYGNILEELMLLLAKEAGHSVEGTQDELKIGDIKGHRDAVIDGTLVDVKSASSYSFDKFAEHLTPSGDAFGYLDQLGAYHHASSNDPLVTNGRTAAFLVVDKTLGKVCLDVHPSTGKDYSKLVEQKKEMLEQLLPPPRAYFDQEDGKSGNRKLTMECSYCSFKAKCWPSLRGFAYSNGPRFLTTVARLPDVPEIQLAA